MQTNRVAAIADFGRTSSAKATSDEVLLQLVADGDKDAMRVLFARHNVRVFRFLTRIVGNEATAEDLLNEVFLEVWRNAGRFEARSQVSTWILAIARFKALAAGLPKDDCGEAGGSWQFSRVNCRGKLETRASADRLPGHCGLLYSLLFGTGWAAGQRRVAEMRFSESCFCCMYW